MIIHIAKDIWTFIRYAGQGGPLWSSSFAHLVVHFFKASALTWNDLKNLEPIVTDYHIEQLDNNSVYIAQPSYIGP